ncbi:unnamed protein product [Trichogramma brassicae]|uniref:Uncharacterized protein n=1 Tax=Trichogramma brassicae TaxID=86971 RepID=A0A6H5J6E3_9HYME|nr:unnamed protein product [Trichogramma brassicae]
MGRGYKVFLETGRLADASESTIRRLRKRKATHIKVPHKLSRLTRSLSVRVPPKADDPDSTVPSWFLGFQQKIVGHFERVVDRVLDRLDIIVKIQHKHEEAIAQNAREIAELSRRLSGELMNLKNRQMANEHALANLQERSATTEETSTTVPVPASTVTEDCHDDCEVRLSSLPVKLNPCDITNVKHVLEALGEERLLPHVIRVREWKAKPRVSAANSAISQIDTAAKHIPDTKACVLRFASANARESFLAAAPRFQRLPVSKIFVLPEAEDGRLSAAPILPPERYRLLRRCWLLRKQHKLPNPVVRNMRIYMRGLNRTNPTLINTEADLDAFAIAILSLSSSSTSSRHPPPTNAS